MPSYRFILPKNAIRAKVDDLITDAATFGGISNTTPYLTLLSFEAWQYTVFIKNLSEEDASYLMLKHGLTLAISEIYYD